MTRRKRVENEAANLLPEQEGEERLRKTVSFSELSDLRQCGFKWSLSYAERWASPTVSTTLSRGTLFHAMLEEHYKRLKRLQGDVSGPLSGAEMPKVDLGAIAAQKAAQSPREAENFEAEAELVQWVYDGYREHWAEADSHWEVLEVEEMLTAPLGVGERSGIEFWLKGKIDLTVRDWSHGGALYIVDHKTCKNLPNGKEIDLDDQMGLYTALKRDAGLDVAGVIYDAARTQRNKTGVQKLEDRFMRIPTTRTDGELAVLKAEALDEFDRIWADILTTRKRPPRRPNTDTCRWKCAYTEACLMSRREGGDIAQMLTDMGYEKTARSGNAA